MTEFTNWRVISEKADTKGDNSGQVTVDTSNLDNQSNSLTANGITLTELDEITDALAGSAKDIKKLRSVAKKVNEGKSLLDDSQSRNLLDGSARGLQSKDLQWAVSSSVPEGISPAVPKTELSKENSSFFNDLVQSVKHTENDNYLENGKGSIAVMNNFSSEDWIRIREKMEDNSATTSHLPEIQILEVEDTKTENAEEVDTEISIKKTEEGLVTEDKIAGITTTTKDGVTIAEMEDGVSVTRDSNSGRTIYEENGERIYEQLADGRRLITLDAEDGYDIATTENGVEIRKDGEVITTVMRQYTWQESDEGVVASVRGAKTPEEALAMLRRYKDLTTTDKDIILARTGGASLVRNGKIVADFEHDEAGKLTEAKFYVSENKQLVRTGDGQILIREPNKQDIALNDEQLTYIIENLGDNAKFIGQALSSLRKGTAVDLGNEVSIDVSKDLRGQIGRERQGERIPLRFHVAGSNISTVDAEGLTTTRNNTTGDTTIESPNGKTAHLEPTDGEFNISTEDLELKDGRVTFTDSEVVINKDGSFELANGTTINTDSSVVLSDGTTISGDGRVTRFESSRATLEANQPSQKSLEVYNSFAKSIANSVKGRAKAGAVSLSDIALLRANLSILANYIGFFSQVGNMEVVNTLRSSWALVKASLDEAEPTVKRKQELAKMVRKEEEKRLS